MEVVRAFYDGHNIKPMEPIKTKGMTEVIVVFPNKIEKFSQAEARRLLKGSGKGERLTEKLLKSREEDVKLEEKK